MVVSFTMQVAFIVSYRAGFHNGYMVGGLILRYHEVTYANGFMVEGCTQEDPVVEIEMSTWSGFQNGVNHVDITTWSPSQQAPTM